MMTVGTINDADDFDVVKRKCAAAFNIDVSVEHLVLTRGSAKIDKSAFTTLGHFLSCLSAQQRSKISFGIGTEVYPTTCV